MDLQAQLQILGNVALAMLLSSVIGLERELAHKPAGLRTHMLLGGAASLLTGLAFTIVRRYAATTDYPMLKVDPTVVIQAAGSRLGDQRREIMPQSWIFDAFNLLLEIDPAVPNLQPRKPHEAEHVLAVGRNGAGRQAARAFARHVRRLSRDGDACGQPLDVDGEVDAGQRLIKIVDVEQNVVFRRVEGAKIHQMTVAAGLNRCTRDRLMCKIVRHHRRRAAQKRKRILGHPSVALGQELRHSVFIALRENRDSVPIKRPMQIGVEFTRGTRTKQFPLFESL